MKEKSYPKLPLFKETNTHIGTANHKYTLGYGGPDVLATYEVEKKPCDGGIHSANNFEPSIGVNTLARTIDDPTDVTTWGEEHVPCPLDAEYHDVDVTVYHDVERINRGDACEREVIGNVACIHWIAKVCEPRWSTNARVIHVVEFGTPPTDNVNKTMNVIVHG